MILTVKSGFYEKLFYGPDNARLAVLRSRALCARKVVRNAAGNVLFEADAVTLPGMRPGSDRQYVLRRGGTAVLTAWPLYRDDADFYSLSHAPRPIGLQVCQGNAPVFSVRRENKSGVEIAAGAYACHIAAFLSRGPQTWAIPDASDSFLWVGLYALISYMMQEDDTIII